ncbi:glycoside hydrolase family 20 zincin-like fold domain-containing protein [Streptomyces sp. MS1.HAVA.3]|uniref:Glycoside hydrolase family 20 zincin-like fold domain-containing protein n=1 Tax=Streptomyces caledonius TaxID=3134107 RepID=A0ABU8U8X5_9ACTN
MAPAAGDDRRSGARGAAGHGGRAARSGRRRPVRRPGGARGPAQGGRADPARASPRAPLPERGTLVRLQDAGAQEALLALGATAATDLPNGGYRLAVGRPGGRDTVALAGVGEEGLFHAAQTLRQLLAAGRGKVPGSWCGTGRPLRCAGSPRASTDSRGPGNNASPRWTSWAAPSRTGC